MRIEVSFVEAPRDDRSEVGGLAGDPQPTLLELGQIEQVVDEQLETTAVDLDPPGQVRDHVRVELSHPSGEGLGKARDRGERGPQLVGDHGQEVAAEPLELSEAGDARHLALEQLRVLDGGRDGGDEGEDERPRPGVEGIDAWRVELHDADRAALQDQGHAEVGADAAADALGPPGRVNPRVDGDVGDVAGLAGGRDRAGHPLTDGDPHAEGLWRGGRVGGRRHQRIAVDQLDGAAAEVEEPAQGGEAGVEDLLEVEVGGDRPAQLEQQRCVLRVDRLVALARGDAPWLRNLVHAPPPRGHEA